MKLTINEDETDSIGLWEIDDVKKALLGGQFKIDAALVWIDFFIRHGIISSDNEPDLQEIYSRIHRKLPFPTHYTGSWDVPGKWSTALPL